jgi:hypothetical protein
MLKFLTRKSSGGHQARKRYPNGMRIPFFQADIWVPPQVPHVQAGVLVVAIPLLSYLQHRRQIAKQATSALSTAVGCARYRSNALNESYREWHILNDILYIDLSCSKAPFLL